jgi:hypothetical protein
VPGRASQDARDAIAAALTARLHAEGRTECFGGIVVPAARPAAAGGRARPNAAPLTDR